MSDLEPHPEPDLNPEDVLFIGAVGSRNKRGAFALGWLALMLSPLAFAPIGWWFLPYSVPVGGLFLWCLFCVATDQHWKITVTRKRVTWDRLFWSTPFFVHVAEIDNVWLMETDDGREVVLNLKGGKAVKLPQAIVTHLDQERLVDAIKQALKSAQS